MSEVADVTAESLLVFSDVHLGSDLNDAGPVVPRSAAIDRDLARLLVHYRQNAPPSGRWKIVIAGDFIDFVGMAIDPERGDELDTALTAEELAHGVGGAEDHARLKLRRVARRHADVFSELAAFVAAGNTLTILHGNHDLEFHWDGVRDDFRALLFACLAGRPDAPDGFDKAFLDAFSARIEFNPWFFYRDGVVYIEHGHQYDPFCATAFLMAPVSPLDPRRVVRAFSDVLLRFVVRRTQGMKEHGHENRGLASYITFGLGLGLAGTWALFLRYVRSIVELFRIRKAYRSHEARTLREEHDGLVARFAGTVRIEADRLRKLLSLQSTPISLSFRGILASVLLDRVALAIVAMTALVGVGVGLRGHAAPWIVGILVAWGAMLFYLSRQRTVDPAENMRERASHLAKLFPAQFVVMGHTHVPFRTPAGDATYINLGSWAEEEDDEETVARGGPGYRAARTHLVIHQRDGAVEAQLYEWHPDEGPRVRRAA